MSRQIKFASSWTFTDTDQKIFTLEQLKKIVPDSLERAITFARILRGYRAIHIHTTANEFFGKESEYNSFEVSLESGKSYLDGAETPMKEFKKKRASSVALWMRPLVNFVFSNPEIELYFDIERGNLSPLSYTICRRGEYVEIGLPHHDAGGEKHWITKNLTTKYLVNVD